MSAGLWALGSFHCSGPLREHEELLEPHLADELHRAFHTPSSDVEEQEQGPRDRGAEGPREGLPSLFLFRTFASVLCFEDHEHLGGCLGKGLYRRHAWRAQSMGKSISLCFGSLVCCSPAASQRTLKRNFGLRPAASNGPGPTDPVVERSGSEAPAVPAVPSTCLSPGAQLKHSAAISDSAWRRLYSS